LKKGQRLYSINEMSDEFLLSRDTVEKAYNVLREEGIISSVKGKGYYIAKPELNSATRILLVFNKISNYKKQVYHGFIETLGSNAVVDLKIHHFNTQVFKSLIENHIDDYDYFVIMPHFYEEIEEAINTINSIPKQKLVILDKKIPQTSDNYASVYQDFEKDIVEALEQGLDLLEKYNKILLVYPKMIPYPTEIIKGFRNFCFQNNFKFEIISEIDASSPINAGEVYIVIEEPDLVNLIKLCRSKKLDIGKDIGIISYNETPLKEILLDGITVISTDHHQMGVLAAQLIIDHRQESIKNPFVLIRRKSL
jgi:DNA-binding transcriptional regulator YhcF (GntR family)